MMHLNQLIREMDEQVTKALVAQVPDQKDPRFGGFLLSNDHVEPRMSGFVFSKLALAYMCVESAYYMNPRLESALAAALLYMDRVQRPDGCFDLSGCNFASAPDTAFMINAVLNAWWVLEKRQVTGAMWLREKMYRLIDSACTGIAAGGFHTPNHRWAIASCLKSWYKVTGREELNRRADEYLNEGLDINDDGEFAERSAGNYNQVNDDQMIRLYLATGDVSFLEAARLNLEMMYCYIDPDESVFTNNSTRQDYGRKLYTESYYDLFLLVGWFLKRPDLGAMAEWVFQSARRHGCRLPGAEWLLLFPEMDGYGADAPLEKPFERYDRLFKDSKIARVRNGRFSYTLMEARPNFLYFQSGALSMYMVIYANLCDTRNFSAQSLEKTVDGYRLKAHAEGWYYLPFYPEKPATSDWWAMDNPHTRPKMQGMPLDTTVEVTQKEDGIDVRIQTQGIDRLPLRVELGFLPGCEVRADNFILEGKAGEAITLLGGGLKVKSRQGDIIIVEGAFGSHNVQSRSGGAYPQSNEHFTVYMTGYTPVDRVIHLQAAHVLPFE